MDPAWTAIASVLATAAVALAGPTLNARARRKELEIEAALAQSATRNQYRREQIAAWRAGLAEAVADRHHYNAKDSDNPEILPESERPMPLRARPWFLGLMSHLPRDQRLKLRGPINVTFDPDAIAEVIDRLEVEWDL